MFSAPQPRSRLYTTTGAYCKAAAAVLLGHGYSGARVEKFERSLEEMQPGHRAIAMPMARVGIYLALKHLIRTGQKVILSPYTISDVVNMVLCAGGVPVFADIEKGGSYNIDPDIVRELLAANDHVGAVLVTHFYGLVCNISPILAACAQKGIPVIEDAAQAFGAKLNGKPAGSFGHAGVFSFGLLKNVTGFVGGAVLTGDAALESKIRRDLESFRIFPRAMLLKKMMAGAMFDTATFPAVFDTSVYWLFRYTYLRNLSFFDNQLDTDQNPVSYSAFPEKYAYRMSGVQADIIRAQFPRYPQDNGERIGKARIYHDELQDLPGLVLPPWRSDGSHIYLYYAIQCEDRDRLARAMTRKLRDIQVSHHRNCASLPCFSVFFRDCPNAERAARNVLYLPTYPGYKEGQVRANIEVIREYFQETNS